MLLQPNFESIVYGVYYLLTNTHYEECNVKRI